MLEANKMIYYSSKIDLVSLKIVSMVKRFSKGLIEKVGKSSFGSFIVYKGWSNKLRV